MKKIIYEGNRKSIRILGLGDFKRGKKYDVSSKEAERLLRIEGFREVKTKKGGNK